MTGHRSLHGANFPRRPGQHVCPIRPCFTQVSDRLLMCGPHWAKVDAPLQGDVYAALRTFGLGSAELLAAQVAAIRSVYRALGLPEEV